MSEHLTGGCLCEAVRYVCDGPALNTVHCYCRDCRKLGGTGHATHAIFKEKVFSVTGALADYVKTADSGRTINRRFCPVCGSAIYHTRDGMEGLVVVRASSLDDPEAVTPSKAIYAAQAPSWDPVDTRLECFEEMPPQKT